MRHSAFCSPGPTGYSTNFADIGKRFGPIDLAAIPIETYEARWLMSSSHVNPEEAVDIHLDVRARYSVASIGLPSSSPMSQWMNRLLG
jgi:N-acyl-phosphatidylethanolamine-hydrolysing phospholipase D